MTRSLDNDEKGTQIVSTLGGNQEMMVITQSGCFFHTALKTRVDGDDALKQCLIDSIGRTQQAIQNTPPVYFDKGSFGMEFLNTC